MKSLLEQELEPLIADLEFTSETDFAPVAFFQGDAVKAMSFDEFFEDLTARQDWFEDEQIKEAQKWADIRSVMEKRLTDLEVKKVGAIDIVYYIQGTDDEGRRAGITFRTTET